MQSVVAPALSSVVKMEDGVWLCVMYFSLLCPDDTCWLQPCKLTFGHSLEINLVSDLKITLNNKQVACLAL